MVDPVAAKTVAPATVEPTKPAATQAPYIAGKPATAPAPTVRPGQNALSDSPGSFDHATANKSANVGLPGANRTVIGDKDSAAGVEPVWRSSEHITIAEEQRLRSEAYVKDLAAYHKAAQVTAVDPTKA